MAAIQTLGLGKSMNIESREAQERLDDFFNAHEEELVDRCNKIFDDFADVEYGPDKLMLTTVLLVMKMGVLMDKSPIETILGFSKLMTAVIMGISDDTGSEGKESCH